MYINLRRVLAGVSLTGSLCVAACSGPSASVQPVRKDITETVFASGILEAEGTYELTAQTDGYIVRLAFEEGQMITKGQVLAVIQNQPNQTNAQSAEALYQIAKSNLSDASPQLAQARNAMILAGQQVAQDSITASRYAILAQARAVASIEHERATLALENARTEYKNASERYRQAATQARQQLLLQQAQRDINQTVSSHNQIKAIKDGKVYQKLRQEGDFVRQGEPVARIGGTRIRARVSIDEANISKIKIGQQAVIQLNTHATRRYAGRVAEIAPMFDEATQSFVCRIDFVDALDFGIIHTQLQANIIIGTVPNALLIPRNYLGYGGEVLLKDTKTPVKITTGIVSTDWVQVIAGLDEQSTLIKPSR